MTQAKKEYERRRYLEHIEERKAYQREYYRTHREEILMKKHTKTVCYIEPLEDEHTKEERRKDKLKYYHRYYIKNRDKMIANALRRYAERKRKNIE